MKSMNSIENKLSEEEFIIFSEDEINIINKLINAVHNNENTIILNKSFYIGSILLRESIKNWIIKKLRDEHSIDNYILKSFENKNIKMYKIDKNNIFKFNFIWNENLEKYIDLSGNYEKVTFTRIGFNKRKTKAIIFLELIIRDEGNGKFYLLEKKNEEWEIIDIIHIFDLYKMKN